MKTTKKDFAIFKAECLRLQKLWGLNGWCLRFAHVYMGEEVQARCCQNLLQHGALLKFSTSWVVEQEEAKTCSSVREKARHEMIHVLTAPLRILADARHVTVDEVDAADHDVLQHLDKVLP